MTIYVAFNFSDAIMLLFGGLALFLFGINMMSSNLKAVAGNRLKSIIEKTTNTPIKGVLVGIMLTVALQTSSGSTVLIIGLLRAGLMTFPQSIGVIMGANIGTTVTSFIIGLPIVRYGLYIIAVGVLLTFMPQRKVKNIGGTITGLGLIFYGLKTMEGGLKPLAATEFAEDMFIMFSNNWFLGTTFGTFFTFIVQSSSASIGVLQKLYEINREGIESIQLVGAIPILLGANIGTTITAMIASIGGNKDSRRAAVVHVLFNVIGAFLFLLVLVPYTQFIQWIERRFLQQFSMLTIAFAHAFQNITTAIILIFFTKRLAQLTKFIVKDDPNQIIPEQIFDESLIKQSPVLALEAANKALLYMGSIVKDYLALTKSFSFKDQPKLVEEAFTFEMMLDTYDQKLHDYLIKISEVGLSKDNSKKLSRDLDTIRDFERIGDHLTNIIEFFIDRYENSSPLTEEGAKDLNVLYEVLETMVEYTLKSLATGDKILAKQVIELEDTVDELEEKFRYRYIERLKNRETRLIIVSSYADILANLERIGDHLTNIAGSVIEPMYVPLSILVPKIHEIDKDT
ncbi:MAG: Na/Pi cotransporter family protein [Acholeplasmataceae bacterium]